MRRHHSHHILRHVSGVFKTGVERWRDVRPQQGESSGQRLPPPHFAPSARAAPTKVVAARAAVRARRTMAAAVLVWPSRDGNGWMSCNDAKRVPQLSTDAGRRFVESINPNYYPIHCLFQVLTLKQQARGGQGSAVEGSSEWDESAGWGAPELERAVVASVGGVLTIYVY